MLEGYYNKNDIFALLYLRIGLTNNIELNKKMAISNSY